MLCKHPFVRDPTGRIFTKAKLLNLSPEVRYEIETTGIPFPCGQCLSCRINRRRIWTLRLVLERFCHKDAAFVTLTYSPENLPVGGTLVKEHVQLFLKRLRKSFPSPLRYFCAGEYGARTFRPHYHLIIFGLAPGNDSLLSKSWGKGLIHCGSFSLDSASYVAGYVTKKHVHKNDPLKRLPEFILSSRRPGIGFGAVSDLCETFHNNYLEEISRDTQKLPSVLKICGKLYPLGRYISAKCQLFMEFDNSYTHFIDTLSAKYHMVRQENKTLVEALLEEGAQRNRQIAWRFKNYNTQQRDKI